MVGATGADAGAVLPELVERGAHVRALVRDERRAEDALARGAAETALGDLNDPASLRAALALTGDRLSYGTFELCAPGMVDRVEMAAIASEEPGRPVHAEVTPLEEWAARMPEGPERDGLVRMMRHYDTHGFPGGNSLVLSAVLGREPRTLRGCFRELAQAS